MNNHILLEVASRLSIPEKELTKLDFMISNNYEKTWQ